MKDEVKSKLVKFFGSGKIQILIVVFLTAAVYANTLFNGFVWDDPAFIKEWQLIRTFKGIPYILKGAYPASDAGKYRPMKGIILTLNNKLFGVDPFYYHLQGIFIHLGATALVYAVIKQMVVNGSWFMVHGEKQEPNELSTINYKRLLPFLAALLFGLHPVHVEAVTFITSSTDILGIVFLLASFYFYLKQQEIGRRLTGNFWFALMFALLAFMTNEITLVLPLLLILYDLCFKHDFKIPAFKFYAPFFALGAGILILRYFVLKIGSYTGGYFAGDFLTNMLLMPKVILKYILLLFFPYDLNVNHQVLGGNLALRYVDFNPEYAARVAINNPQVYLSAVVVFTVLVVSILVYRKLPIVTFLIGWFFISIIPVANIVPINILLAERYIYLASLAFCLGAAIVFVKLFNIKGVGFGSTMIKLAGVSLLFLLVIFYSKVTILRNLDWKNEKALWLKTVSQQPQSVIANYNLGSAYLVEGENARAVEYLEHANSMSHLYFGKMSVNLARAYLRLNEPDKAILELNRAIAQSPENWSGYSYLGDAYARLGKQTRAIENYKTSIVKNPNYYDARIGLAGIYTGQQKYEKAMEQLNVAKLLNPYVGASYNNIALIYYKAGKVDEAIAELERGIKMTGDKKLSANLAKITSKGEINEEEVIRGD